MPARFKLVAVTFLLSLLLYIDRACISAAKGPISESLGLSDKQIGWVLSAFTVGYALAQTPSGILADRLGPRKVLAAVVTFWSFFTAMTGAAWSFVSMLVSRFLFGVGEAAAFPGLARATFSWFPVKERGLVTGINFSASRLGGAAAMFAMPLLIDQLGWRTTFYTFGGVGIVWAAFWFFWFRDDPTEHSGVSDSEREQILATRQQQGSSARPIQLVDMATPNMAMTCLQYFCSNFTFFFCLTWLYPYVKETYNLTAATAGIMAAIPLLGGFVGNLVSGWLVDRLFSSRGVVLSRRVPAIIGFVLAAVGLALSVHQTTAAGAVACLTLAVFGADMTLSPSWSFCVDIGGSSAGAVSGTMNMAGNVGSFATSLAFPYLKDWFGSTTPFFYIGAGLNVGAVTLWLRMRPDHPLLTDEASEAPVGPVDADSPNPYSSGEVSE